MKRSQRKQRKRSQSNPNHHNMSIPFTWVYLIHDPFTNLYKIGKSDNPRERHKTLSKQPSTIPAAPVEYKLVEAWLCPESTEQQLHQTFADVRARGEWFELNDDQVWHLQVILAGYERLIAGDSLDYENMEKLAFERTSQIENAARLDFATEAFGYSF